MAKTVEATLLCTKSPTPPALAVWVFNFYLGKTFWRLAKDTTGFSRVEFHLLPTESVLKISERHHRL